MEEELYSLCEVGVSLRYQLPGQAEVVRRAARQFFHLNEARRANRERQIVVEFRDHCETEHEGHVGATVFSAPGLTLARSAGGFHLHSNGSYLNLEPDLGRGTGFLHPHFEKAPPHHQRGLLLLTFLLLLGRFRRYGLHASAVVHDDAGVLIAGDSGCGKTTLAYALARNNWKFLADDSVILRVREGAVEALPFGRGFACLRETARHFPELDAAWRGAFSIREDKVLVDVSRIFPRLFAESCRPRVILVPQRTNEAHSRLAPLDATTALACLIRQSPGFLAGRASIAGQMETLRMLIGDCQCYRLFAGRDVVAAPGALSALLAPVCGATYA